jgi:predicted CXXCH cytochrome family protein
VKLRTLLAGLTILLTGATLPAQVTGDVLGMHSLGPGTKSPISGARPDACAYCHAPHSGLTVGLWNQKLTTQSYTMYTSDTERNRARQPKLGDDSNHCLSCHDGTVAVGNTVAYGQVTTRGSMYTPDVFGKNMEPTHPFSLVTPLKDKIDLAASLAHGKTADPTGAVRLIRGDVECTSCHNPHVQAKDKVSLNFLVKDSSSGQMCLACHDPTRQMSRQVNPLADWSTSAHALSTDKISPQALLGSYTTVAGDACISCHAPHNASGTARLLRGQNEQDCIACHNGGTNISPMAPYANVFSEYAAPKIGHPFPTSNNPHDAAERILLNNNRHATCVDCHNAHGSETVGLFPPPPLIRISQKDIAGISASDGTTVLDPAINQDENCLRCHGASSGKQVLPIYGYFPIRAVSAGDPLNVIPQFAITAASSHPVLHARSSGLPQPSLMQNMANLDGIIVAGNGQGRAMGTQILCTDCHNSDDNREFGGTGPNGPHGSKWTHILERRYEFSTPSTPGGTVENLFPTPDLSVNGPYALCGKCHNLSIVQNPNSNNGSWIYHNNHMNDGFSCSTCHTAHGMGATSGNISGQRLVNFDANIVASNGVDPISYNHGSNTCALLCHGATHLSSGTVAQVRTRKGPLGKK